MESKILEIINYIREGKGLDKYAELRSSDNLRDDFGYTSFDLAELTVRIEDVFDVDIFEDGLVSTVGEILLKLKK